MTTMVISGSANRQHGVQHWNKLSYTVIDHPAPIAPNRFRDDYPAVFRTFYDRLADCYALFVMNEDRLKAVEIIVLQPVGDDVHGADEIRFWNDLSWITFHRDQPVTSSNCPLT